MAAFVAISSRTCSSLPSYKPAFGGGRLVASMNVVALGGLPSRCIRGRPTAERIAQFWTADFLSKSALDTTAKYIQLETNKNKMHTKCPAPSTSPRAPARRKIDRSACVRVACDHQCVCHPASIHLTSSEAATAKHNRHPSIATSSEHASTAIKARCQHPQHPTAIRPRARSRARALRKHSVLGS